MLGYKGGGFNLNIVDITHIEDQNFCKAGTQHPLNPNSGVFVFPKITHPCRLNREVTMLSSSGM